MVFFILDDVDEAVVNSFCEFDAHEKLFSLHRFEAEELQPLAVECRDVQGALPSPLGAGERV